MADFYLAPGGPFDTLMTRLRLVHPRSRVVTLKRAAALALLSWLPLMIFSTIQHLAIGPLRLPFLLNYPEHIRFLIAVPIFILAESVINNWTGIVVKHFTESGIVSSEERPRFDEALANAAHARDSRWAELLLVLLAYSVSFYGQNVMRHGVPRDWFYRPGTNDASYSLAGHWFFWFSGPLYIFLLLRWLWRFLIWTILLLRISKLKLRLVPTHPDELGGLEFVARAQAVFLVVVFAAGCVVASTLDERLTFLGKLPISPRDSVIAYVVGCALMFLGPLIVFTPKLFAAKREGLLSYGLFATAYVRRFDEKWIRGHAVDVEPVLGTGDIQSLSDLGNSVERVTKMRILLYDRQATIAFLVASALPFAPLVLHQVPLSELFKTMIGLVLGHE